MDRVQQGFALHGEAIAAWQRGDLRLAEERARRAIAASGESVFYNTLGVILQAQGRLAEAEEAHAAAIRLREDFVEAMVNLGNALAGLGRNDEAAEVLRRAIVLRPGLGEAHVNLGRALYQRGDAREAVVALREAMRLSPASAEGWNNLGLALEAVGESAEAFGAFERALALRENFSEAQTSLGHMLQREGRIEEAMGRYRRALELRAGDRVASSNLLYAMYFHPRITDEEILEAHRNWGKLIEQKAEARIAPARPPSRERLRVGYVSPNFHVHAVARFLLPIIELHDRKGLEVFCYSDGRSADEMTARLRSHADHWRETAAMPDAQLAAQIRVDEIDVLIDLTLHMASNRMPMFALKPAPVAVTYLAYPGTSGLSAMDFRFTDGWLDPEGSARPYVEESVRLESYWCYAPAEESPEVGELPALRGGGVTFGCLNSFAKASDAAVAAWKRILDAVPQSRLILLARPGKRREQIAAALGGRVEFAGERPLVEYLASYGRIDIALDPFPYAGGTTTCDALWMGVPVVTLAGERSVGRAGVSILNHVGLAELIAPNVDEYVEIARRLAGDVSRLAQLRRGMRQRMRASRLCDAQRMVRDVEAKIRWMWQSRAARK